MQPMSKSEILDKFFNGRAIKDMPSPADAYSEGQGKPREG